MCGIGARLIGVSNRAFPFSPASNCSATLAELFFARLLIPLDNYVCLTYICSMKRISMFLSDSQIAKLKKLAKRTGIKMSELVRRFIDEGLKRI